MEIYQEFGNDLVVENGDLLPVDGVELTNQRVIRRLLTAPISVSNPPDYLANPTYGAGLPQFVGRNETQDVYNQITGLITSQMYLEATVSQNPAPVITILGLTGQINVQISYKNLLTNTQEVITFVYPPQK